MGESTKRDADQTDAQELNEEQLESVAGGVIDGGCIPPPFDPPWKVPDGLPGCKPPVEPTID